MRNNVSWSLHYTPYNRHRRCDCMALAGTVDKSVVCVVCGKNGLSCGKNAIHWHTGARHSAHLQMTTLPMTDHFNVATTYSVHLELGLPFIRGLIWRGRQTRLPYAPAASGREPSWSVPGWTRFAPTPSSSPVSTSVHHRRVTPLNVAAAMHRPWND